MHVELTEIVTNTTKPNGTEEMPGPNEDGEAEPGLQEGLEQELTLLEQAAGNWTILIYGGIYEYRRDFDMLEIEGGYIDLEGDKREFVRTVLHRPQRLRQSFASEHSGRGCVQAMSCRSAQCHR